MRSQLLSFRRVKPAVGKPEPYDLQKHFRDCQDYCEHHQVYPFVDSNRARHAMEFTPCGARGARSGSPWAWWRPEASCPMRPGGDGGQRC